MNYETYLDYGGLIKAKFSFTQQGLSCRLSCDADNQRLGQTIITNLQSISTIKYMSETDSYRYQISDTIFVDISRTTGQITNINKLTAFEVRMLAQSKKEKVPFNRDSKTSYLPKTDLHTHFAGAIETSKLIEIGLKHNILYPKWALNKMGIDTSKYSFDDKGNIVLRNITPEDLKTMENHLKITPVSQELFTKMEEVYALRGPFTKNKEAFEEYLWILANDYKQMGVEYTELSFSAYLTNPDFLQILEDNLPQIEKETGVKLRFLGAFWRHSDKEWNLDDVDRLKAIAKSPYIVGCDFMGHEINQTLTFEEELQMLARYAMEEDPNFVIRVHAGENPIFKTNVYDALKIIYDEHTKLEQETGHKFPMPKVRIGHGLYGLDITEDGKWNKLEPNAVLKLAKEMGAIIEFNMSSNLALNNINDITDVPIKQYIDAGISVVLGTDGHGMYSTFSGQEALLASAAGLTEQDFEKIYATEQEVIANAIQREQTHPRLTNIQEIYDNVKYSTPDGKPRYNSEVEAKYRQERENVANMLAKQIADVGAITDEEIIERDTKGKTPIVLSGASKKAWPKISPEDQEKIKVTMQVLADTLNPETTFIVTGGTNFGVEKTMHEAVYRRNKNNAEKMVLLGTLTMEAARNGDKEIEENTITHAVVLDIDGHKANNWMDLPDTQLEYALNNNGELIAVGGGSIVNDIIQRAYNLGVDMYLMDGPNGASTDKSRSLEGNNLSFKTVEELIQRLYAKNPDYFSKGFDISNIEQYVQQATQEVMDAEKKEQEEIKYNNYEEQPTIDKLNQKNPTGFEHLSDDELAAQQELIGAEIAKRNADVAKKQNPSNTL